MRVGGGHSCVTIISKCPTLPGPWVMAPSLPHPPLKFRCGPVICFDQRKESKSHLCPLPVETSGCSFECVPRALSPLAVVTMGTHVTWRSKQPGTLNHGTKEVVPRGTWTHSRLCTLPVRKKNKAFLCQTTGMWGLSCY